MKTATKFILNVLCSTFISPGGSHWEYARQKQHAMKCDKNLSKLHAAPHKIHEKYHWIRQRTVIHTSPDIYVDQHHVKVLTIYLCPVHLLNCLVAPRWHIVILALPHTAKGVPGNTRNASMSSNGCQQGSNVWPFSLLAQFKFSLSPLLVPKEKVVMCPWPCSHCKILYLDVSWRYFAPKWSGWKGKREANMIIDREERYIVYGIGNP
jgi:hypothetical protein